MEKIEAYRTIDGQIFTTIKDAKDQESILEIEKWFYLNKIGNYNIPFVEFLGMLHEHKKSLMELLKRINNETLSGQ